MSKLQKLIPSILTACSLLLLPLISSAQQIFEPEGVNMPGQWNGFTNTNDGSVMGNFRMAKRDLGGGQYITTINIQSTGGDTTAGTYDMLFTSGPEATPFQNKWANATLTIDDVTALTLGGATDNSITVQNGFYYRFVFADAGYNDTNVGVMRTSAEPVTISAVTGVPSGGVGVNQPVTITVELDKAKSAEEKVYVRYSTDEFATSTAVEITDFGSGTTGTATIPGQSADTIVDFYVMTTTVDASSWGTNADLFTIDYDNNNSSNYRYIYNGAITISPLNGALNVTRTPQLAWDQVSGATSYQLQLDDNNDFSSPIVDEATVTDSTYTISEANILDPNTTFYWRFQADTQSDWSPTFSFSTITGITFANLQFPTSQSLFEDSSFTVFGQVNIPNITDQAGADGDVSVWIGVNSTDENPANWAESSWSLATFNEDKNPNDEYQATIGSALDPGEYFYAFRYQYQSQPYEYGATNGFWESGTNENGKLQVKDTPTLVSPLDAATDQTLTPTLEWSTTDSNIQGFDVRVAETEAFTTPVFEQTDLTAAATSTTISSGSLAYNSTYYWQVRANYDTTNGIWSAPFSFQTVNGITDAQLAGADSASVDSGATITYSGDVTVPGITSTSGENSDITAWIGFSASGGDPSTWPEAAWQSASFSSDESSGDRYTANAPTTLAPDIYNVAWRFQYQSQDFIYAGIDGIWDATNHPSGALLVKQLPALLQPVDNAVDVPSAFELKWRSSDANITGFEVQVAESGNFSSPVIDQTGLDNGTDTLEISSGTLAFSTAYQWRVRAQYDTTFSGWSAPFSFTTSDGLPARVVLSTPADGSENLSLVPQFTWQDAADAESYTLQIATGTDFTTGQLALERSGLTGTSFTVPSTDSLNPGVPYFWRVSGVNTQGQGAWSDTLSFETEIETPTLVSPAQSAIDQSLEAELTWSSATKVSGYDLQVATENTFSTIVLDTLAHPDTVLTTDPLDFTTNYFWRVRSRFETHVGDWSTIGSFTTRGPAPTIPILVSPDSGNVTVAIEPVLDWNASEGAETYQLQFSSTADFSGTLLADSSDITGTEYEPGLLEFETSYYWRVRAFNTTAGFSDWSKINGFTTVPDIPAIPTPSAPADNSAKLTAPVSFAWSAPAKADRYQFQLSKDAGFTFTIDSVVTSPSLDWSELDAATRYYWRVKAGNSGGFSDWSTVSGFSTGIAGFAGPSLVEPADEAVDLSQPITFSWSAIDSADTYQLQISAESAFTTTALDSSNITAETLTIEGLEKATAYYARVRAVSEEGATNWSPTIMFQTLQALPALTQLAVPANEDVDVPLPAVLRWLPTARAESYQLRISADPEFQVRLDSTNISDTTVTLSSLANDQTYYWRVRASNSAGTGAWSATASFTTALAAPAIPELVTPGADESATIPVNFGWNESARAENYHIQVSDSDAFTNLVIDSTEITGVSVTIDTFDPLTNYFWRVRAVNRSAESDWSPVVAFRTGVVTSLPMDELPDEFALHQNYPNPFNPSTVIPFDLKEAGSVRIQIYDISGRLVQELLNENKTAGRYQLTFDAAHLASGMYIIRMVAGNYVSSRKMMLIK